MRLLIVDDEQRITEDLQRSIPWSEFGIEEVVAADSGEAGYDAFVSNRPDIVITDIMMGGMSGLDMIRSIRQIDEQVPVLILSAFELFSYAKEALTLNVTRYILKPLDFDDIASAIREIVEELRAQQKLREYQTKIHEQTHGRREAIKEKFLYDALTLPTRFDDTFAMQLDALGIDRAFLSGGLVMSLQTFRPNNGKASTENDWQIYRFAVQNIVQEVLERRRSGLPLPFRHDTMSVLYIGSDRNAVRREASLATTEVIQQIYAYLEIEANAAIGQWYAYPKDYAQSYKESIEVLKFSEFEGYKRVDHAEDVQELAVPGTLDYPLKEIQAIVEAVRQRDWKEAGTLWSGIETSIFSRCETLPFEFVKMICVGLLSAIVVQPEHASELARLTELQQMRSKADLLAHVRAFLERGTVESASSRRNQSYTDYIKKYVSEHYNEDISFSRLAKDLHLSRPYLSYLFNRDTGETFANYLIQYRVNVAKKFMRSSKHLMVREIAAMVGYADPAYFSRIFKHVTGMSPSEYQMRN